MTTNKPREIKYVTEENFTQWVKTNDPTTVIDDMRTGKELNPAQLSQIMHPVSGSTEIFTAHAKYSKHIKDTFIKFCMDTFAYNALSEISKRNLLEKEHLEALLQRGMYEAVLMEMGNRSLKPECLEILIESQAWDLVKKAAREQVPFSEDQVTKLLENDQFEIAGLLSLNGYEFNDVHKALIEKAGFGQEATKNRPAKNARTISRGDLHLVTV